MAGYVLHLSTEENITLSSATVKRLIAGGSGDAALLYLAILHARGAADSGKLARELKWDETRLRAAEQALYEMKLVGAPEKKEAPLPPPQQLSEPPEYTREDIARKLEGDGRFACLLREVEHKLGPLSTPSVKKLLGLYENLGLPADVVYTLVNYCIAKKEQQFGEGGCPTCARSKKGLRLGAQGALFHRKGQRVHEARASPARQVPRVHGGAANAGPRERAERGKVSLRVGGDGISGGDRG
ncbi:MAG: DnaD domain protein [Oscillibacter sp.]